jgi:hypothetical protein
MRPTWHNVNSSGSILNWIYDRIQNGTIKIGKSECGMYLFPDEPATYLAFEQLRDGAVQTLDYREGH